MIDQDAEQQIAKIEVSFDYDQNSRNLLDIHRHGFTAMAILATSVKETIDKCMSKNVYAHPTLLASTNKKIEEMMKKVDYFHDNNSYNIMMCIGETIDKHIEGATPDVTLFGDTITKYYEMAIPEVLVKSEITTKLCRLLKVHKSRQTIMIRDKLNNELIEQNKNLTTLISGSSFLAQIATHPSIQNENATREIVEAVTRFTIKNNEEENSIEDVGA